MSRIGVNINRRGVGSGKPLGIENGNFFCLCVCGSGFEPKRKGMGFPILSAAFLVFLHLFAQGPQ